MPRVRDVVLAEQFDSEGDTVWALTGRGEPVCTYSIREIDALILERLTLDERIQLDERNSGPRDVITRVSSLPDRCRVPAKPPLAVLRLENGKPNYASAAEQDRFLRESGALARSRRQRKPADWPKRRAWPEPWEEWIARQNDPRRSITVETVEPEPVVLERSSTPDAAHPWRQWNPNGFGAAPKDAPTPIRAAATDPVRLGEELRQAAATADARKIGRPPKLRDAQVHILHREYTAGRSIAAIAADTFEALGYPSRNTAECCIARAFRRLDVPTRSRGLATRMGIQQSRGHVIRIDTARRSRPSATKRRLAA